MMFKYMSNNVFQINKSKAEKIFREGDELRSWMCDMDEEGHLESNACEQHLIVYNDQAFYVTND